MEGEKKTLSAATGSSDTVDVFVYGVERVITNQRSLEGDGEGISGNSCITCSFATTASYGFVFHLSC